MASTMAMWATIIATALAAIFAGPGLAVLATILGIVLVVVLATREENRRIRDLRRSLLRDAAWREMGKLNDYGGRG